MSIFSFLITFPILIVSVILHEIAHGLAAEKLGDDTARKLGRITLNPIPHIDPFMTIVLPALLIISGSPVVLGGAKPVPIDAGQFANPRRGMCWVALAGPLTNILIALLGCVYLYAIRATGLYENSSDVIASGLVMAGIYMVVMNLVLAVFNLTPIPPLDGGRILIGLLPLKFARQIARLEPIGIYLVVALLLFGVIDRVINPLLAAVLRNLQWLLT